MHEATFQPTPELASKVVQALQQPWVLQELGAPTPPALIRQLATVVRGVLGAVVLLLLIGITTSGARIRPWQVLVMTVLSVLYGGVAVALGEERKRMRLVMSLVETSHPITYSLGQDGISVSVNQTRSFTPWNVVRRVILLEAVVLILREDALMYIPREAFPTEQALYEFRSYVTQHLPIQGAETGGEA